MSVNLKKGEKIALSKDNKVDEVSVCIGWDVSKYDDGDVDLDVSAFVLNKNGTTRCDEDLVFYNNLVHPTKSVIHSGDNLTGKGDGDDEVIKVNLERLPKYADKVVFCVTINEAERRMQNFEMIDNAYIRVVDDKSHKEILRYNMTEKFGNNTSVIAGEIYKDSAEWKFHALGDGYMGGLAEFCEKFGIEVG